MVKRNTYNLHQGHGHILTSVFIDRTYNDVLLLSFSPDVGTCCLNEGHGFSG